MRKFYIVILLILILVFFCILVFNIEKQDADNFFRFIGVLFNEKKVKKIKKEEVINHEELKNKIKNQKYIAIIFDDAGLDKNLELLNIKKSINISILPEAPYTSLWLKNTKNKTNIETLIHIPMASFNKPSSGLTPYMNENKLKESLENMLNKISFAKGANNHEGSFATSNNNFMHLFFKIYKNYNLYFVDSLTTHKSKAYNIAKNYGVKAIRRTHFLDNKKEINYIKLQFIKIIEYIKKNKYAVVIAHTTTKGLLKIFNEMLPEFEKNNIKFVFISELIELLYSNNLIS